MKKNYFFILCLLGILISGVYSCKSKQEASSPVTSSVPYPNAETLVLMHNRKGVRIEYNLNKKQLELWISPQAGKDHDYKIRNFSNRDDNTRLFDKINFPDLDLKDFKSCDYHPYHCVLNFNDQKLHIATLCDQPIVMVWFEKEGVIDFKSDKSDALLQKDSLLFSLSHGDRGLVFDFVARIAPDGGNFLHQYPTDEGRSIYTRAFMKPGKAIYIGGELKKENISSVIKNIASTELNNLLTDVTSKVDSAVSFGQIVLRDNPELQKLLDINKRTLHSMQDESGAIRASIQYIYYLIWVRDGGMLSSYLANSGWLEPLSTWTEYQLLNPTVTDEEPKGRFFGQLVNGKITKWEEDGPFYAIWSAFTHWTQTGDRKFVSGEYLKVMEESVDWLERYCYDSNKKLFGRYHYCEAPLKDSKGFGWDHAVGNPSTKWPAKYQNEDIYRSYDLYMNLIAYSSYMMLSSMQTNSERIQFYAQKANDLKPGIREMYRENDLPAYGTLIGANNKEIQAPAYGMDITDYLWGLSLPYFFPDYENLPAYRAKLYSDMMVNTKDQFLAGYFAVINGLDIDNFSEDSILQAVEYAAKQCYRPGKYLPMPYTIVEMLDKTDGDPYHDIRPQGFSIGAWLGAMTNIAVRRTPFGLSVRNPKSIASIKKYQYKNALIDFEYKSSGTINKISINGKELLYSYQLPENMLSNDKNTVIVEMGSELNKNVELIYSTVQLQSVTSSDNKVTYEITCYADNMLCFRDLPSNVLIFDSLLKEIKFRKVIKDTYTYLIFDGVGQLMVEVKF